MILQTSIPCQQVFGAALQAKLESMDYSEEEKNYYSAAYPNPTLWEEFTPTMTHMMVFHDKWQNKPELKKWLDDSRLYMLNIPLRYPYY
jgi:hypothetical protein